MIYTTSELCRNIHNFATAIIYEVFCALKYTKNLILIIPERDYPQIILPDRMFFLLLKIVVHVLRRYIFYEHCFIFDIYDISKIFISCNIVFIIGNKQYCRGLNRASRQGDFDDKLIVLSLSFSWQETHVKCEDVLS